VVPESVVFLQHYIRCCLWRAVESIDQMSIPFRFLHHCHYYWSDPGGNFLAVPGFWSNYPSYIPFFFAGTIAQRNEWMTSIKNMPRVVIYLWAVLSIVLRCALSIIFSGDDNPIPSWLGLLLGQGIIWKGVLCMGLTSVTVFL